MLDGFFKSDFKFTTLILNIRWKLLFVERTFNIEINYVLNSKLLRISTTWWTLKKLCRIGQMDNWTLCVPIFAWVKLNAWLWANGRLRNFLNIQALHEVSFLNMVIWLYKVIQFFKCSFSSRISAQFRIRRTAEFDVNCAVGGVCVYFRPTFGRSLPTSSSNLQEMWVEVDGWNEETHRT